MTADQSKLLERFHAAGIALHIEGDRILYRAPKGALTAKLRQAFQKHKAGLLDLYRERAAILEYDGGYPRPEAERLAAAMVFTPPYRFSHGVREPRPLTPQSR